MHRFGNFFAMRFDWERARAERIDALAAGRWDVLVVGGGIVGAGVARDAAMRGLRVALVEQHDFAFGTSSRTSRLLHGGMRYLAQGRLGLVYQASREKRTLHRIAPHLADPLAFVFPAYRDSAWPLWQLRLGVKLYDWLCGGRNLGPSSALDPQATVNLVSGLNEPSLVGAVRYYDGLTHDARLVFDTLRSAAGHGAIVGNYCRLEEASRVANGWICRIRDAESGRTQEVHARAVVNATGPWGATFPQSRLRLRLTKGVHGVIDRQRLPIPDAVVMTDESRLLFAIPWGQRVILGTTDTDYDGPPEAVRAEPADMQYILSVVNRFFPKATLALADVRSTWAGVRPLLADYRGRPSDISRAHRITMGEPGWVDVAGGKLTTYRLIAEETVDLLVRFLGAGARRCQTAEQPLLSPSEAAWGGAIVPPEPDRQWIQHYCTREWAVHLDDVMIRRTSWRRYVADHEALADRVAAWMAETLGWDSRRLANEQARYREAAT